MKCEHNFRIFKDSDITKENREDLTGTKKHLTFYCTKCLLLRKIKKEYKE